MRVYLMRHGEAADVGGYDRDDDRPLTSDGRRRVRLGAKLWAERGDPAPEAWLVSPLVRAVQTAEICASAFASESPIEVSRELLPDARVSVAAERIEREAASAIALVGHQPLMGGLAAYLLGLRTVPSQVQPGAILAIDLQDEGAGRLAWHLVPNADGQGPRILVPA
ncbi:phosphohistidine phosphatase SixA [Vulgatibacter incomptus]|uniref:Phosphohistidine phosphatase SixA n=1 Tax=Vulgatibacter incomptus TaxID=1391653 RepID=A0A0K1P8D4_9BACT|nr:phosphohistidine phosphatase SixA [Vulgatibacter incomptus]AKU89691.1 Phosphohistidine phosphatase SixA [Vulgatibacter incomptus]